MRKLASGKLLGPMVLALSIALGAEAVWGFVCIWIQAAAGTGLVRLKTEAIEITRDGQALVRQMQRTSGSWRFTYRTLDGKEVDPSSIDASRKLGPVGRAREKALYAGLARPL